MAPSMQVAAVVLLAVLVGKAVCISPSGQQQHVGEQQGTEKTPKYYLAEGMSGCSGPAEASACSMLLSKANLVVAVVAVAVVHAVAPNAVSCELCRWAHHLT